MEKNISPGKSGSTAHCQIKQAAAAANKRCRMANQHGVGCVHDSTQCHCKVVDFKNSRGFAQK